MDTAKLTYPTAGQVICHAFSFLKTLRQKHFPAHGPSQIFFVIPNITPMVRMGALPDWDYHLVLVSTTLPAMYR